MVFNSPYSYFLNVTSVDVEVLIDLCGIFTDTVDKNISFDFCTWQDIVLVTNHIVFVLLQRNITNLHRYLRSLLRLVVFVTGRIKCNGRLCLIQFRTLMEVHRYLILVV